MVRNVPNGVQKPSAWVDIGLKECWERLWEKKRHANLTFEGCIEQNYYFWRSQCVQNSVGGSKLTKKTVVNVLKRFLDLAESVEVNLRRCQAAYLRRKTLRSWFFKDVSNRIADFYRLGCFQGRVSGKQQAQNAVCRPFQTPQNVQNEIESLPVDTFNTKNLVHLVFDECIEQNHYFWHSQSCQNQSKTVLVGINSG